MQIDLRFNEIVHRAIEALEGGRIKEACRLLDEAMSLATSKEERTVLHDLGNEIQKAVFAEYMATLPATADGMDSAQLS